MSVGVTLVVGLLNVNPAGSEAPRASLEVDTSDVGSSGPIVADRIRENGSEILRDGGILPPKFESDPVVRVVVHEYLEGDPGYRFEVLVVEGRETLRTHRVECRLCTETELLGRVGEVLQAEVPQLRLVEDARAEPQDEPPQATSPQPLQVESPTAEDERRGRLGLRGKLGVGLLSAGGAGLAVGIGLAVAPPRDNDEDKTKNIYTDVPGYVTIGISLGVAVAGGVLLALDLRDASKRRAVALTPLLGPMPGAALSGRF